MPLLRRRTNSDTTSTQPAGSAAVPGQRDTQEGTRSAEPAQYSQGQATGATGTGTPTGTGTATGTGTPTAQAERQQTEAVERRRTETAGYRAETRPEAQRRHYGMAGTLMILSGMLTFFIGITALIRGVFFNNVATFPFYYSVRSRGITLIVIGAALFVVGIALLIRMHWARHVATVVAVIGAVANFIFLPFYPFWSVIVLALNILIIWELERDRVSGRDFARLPRVPR